MMLMLLFPFYTTGNSDKGQDQCQAATKWKIWELGIEPDMLQYKLVFYFIFLPYDCIPPAPGHPISVKCE